MMSVPEMRKKQIVFVLTYEGDKISFSNDNIILKDKDGKIKHQSTCYKLFMIIVVGNISITSGILSRARKFGFAICLMNRNFKVYQMINSSGEGNTLLRKKQYEYDGLELGRHLIQNKISNQISALKYIRGKSVLDKDAIMHLDSYRDSLKNAESINQIMGYEGAAAREYFERVFSNCQWNGRKPRIKADYVNAALDIGYTILFNYVEAMLQRFGFDIYFGVMHRCFYRRKSLVCDLVEPFRPLVDMEVRKAINLGQIKEEDFTLIGKKYVLEWQKSPKYVGIFGKVIVEHKEEMFKYIQGYYRAFMKGLPASEFPVFYCFR